MKNLYYNIFKTRWGWFGLLGNNNGLIRTYLPATKKETVRRRILADAPQAKLSKTSFSVLKSQIINYYKGQKVNFSHTKVSLEGLTEFQQHVLTTLRTVKHGYKVSYGQLAKIAKHPNAARAIGSVMAKNPVPLIIPCHRVIKADGTCGQFSAPGGTKTKIQMLMLEKQGE